ncbi:MAG: sensor histidine kinase [Oscillospiraceae bacterium]|nr:sensor histidine kinase [Oscillospiraceae bacterium]
MLKRNFFLRKLASFLIPIVIPVVLLGALSITLTQKYIKDIITTYNSNLLHQNRDYLELVLKEIDALYLNFARNPISIQILKQLFSSERLDLEQVAKLNTYKSQINSVVNSKPYIHSIYIYAGNAGDKFLSTSSGLSNINDNIDNAWFDIYKESQTDIWTELREIKQYSFERPRSIISIFMKLYSSGISQGDGVIVLNINTDGPGNLLEKLELLQDQSVFILNEFNQIMLYKSSYGQTNDLGKFETVFNEFFYNNSLSATGDLDRNNMRENAGGSLTVDNEKYMLNVLYSERFNWKYISMIPENSLYQLPRELTQIVIILLSLSLIFGISLIFHFTKNNYKNISSIIKLMDSFELNDPLPPAPEIVNDEYGYIMNNLLKTFIEQSRLKIQLTEKKYELQRLEMLALQSQLNPHFLYNTLDTINWKALGMFGGYNDINVAVENLSDILKYMLTGIDNTVSLEEEIKYAQCYIRIQHLRYKDKVNIIWDYNEDDIKCNSVPKLILQPLIENSIYHGLKMRPGKGVIKIRVAKFHSHLRIAIIDNGMGIPEEKLRLLRAELLTIDRDISNIGLYNTNKRIKIMYGEEYGLTILSKSNHGTSVSFKIPMLQRQQQVVVTAEAVGGYDKPGSIQDTREEGGYHINTDANAG